MPVATLSILIPTYNDDCTELVLALRAQAAACLPGRCDVWVGNDGSTRPQVVSALNRLAGMEGVHVLSPPHNLGRAAIRNLLARSAGGDYLLFIDSDARVCRSDFLARYARHLRPGVVVCGSLVNAPAQPGPECSLRFRYEAAAAAIRTLDYRRRHPYAQFTTFNVLMPRGVWQAHPFDERIVDYGFEDAQLGHRLQVAGVPVEQIDNPLMHMGIDTNDEFLDKTRRSLVTLWRLGPEARAYSHLAATAARLRPLRPAIAAVHRGLQRYELRHLLGPRPSLAIFNLYKLGYYCALG